MNKLLKAKLGVFTGIVLVATISYVYHLLPHKAIWLWFPILALLNHWLNWYAEKRGKVLHDEMTRDRTGFAAWWTFAITVAVMFTAIVYYDYNRIQTDPRFILAYLAGFMGAVYLAVYTFYNIRQGVWE